MRPRDLRWWCVCVLAAVLVAAPQTGATDQATSARPQAQASIQDAVARYGRGDFDAAIAAISTRLTVTHFTQALETWIADGDPAAKPHRQRVAAVFALDVSWRATRTFANLTRAPIDPSRQQPPVHPDRARLPGADSLPFVAEWAVAQLPSTVVLDSTERTIWRIAIGLASDGHAWKRLQDRILPLAVRRLPDDPRVALAAVVAGTNIDLGPLRVNTSLHHRHERLRDERLGSSVTGRLPKAVAAYETLLADPSLAAEASLRIGYLELRRERWSAALTRFDVARSLATEPVLIAASDYFAGWVHEQEGRTTEAITAYRRAHAIAPLMRNLATRLSALLYLNNERAEAFAILEPALNARPAPLDFLILLDRGDARFVPEWLAAVRQALR